MGSRSLLLLALVAWDLASSQFNHECVHDQVREEAREGLHRRTRTYITATRTHAGNVFPVPVAKCPTLTLLV